MEKKKRVNKTKGEIKSEMDRTANIERQKALARRMFPLLKTDNIYDAQTAVNALSGFIKYELAIKESEIKVNDLLLDLKNQPDTKITAVMEALKVEFQGESAKDIAGLLERLGSTLSQFSSAKYMQNPMSDIKMEDIIA